MNITRTNRTFTALGALAMGLTALVLAGCAPASGSAAARQRQSLPHGFVTIRHIVAIFDNARWQRRYWRA